MPYTDICQLCRVRPSTGYRIDSQGRKQRLCKVCQEELSKRGLYILQRTVRKSNESQAKEPSGSTAAVHPTPTGSIRSQDASVPTTHHHLGED